VIYLDKVFRWIDKNINRLTDLTLKLISYDTSNPPGDTREISSYATDFFKELGFNVKKVIGKDNKVNLIMSIGEGDKAKLIYNGHMDVVPATSLDKWICDPFKGCIKEGFIYGRGASDMKGSLASIMIAVKSLIENGFEFNDRLEIHFVADEEVGGKYGTKYLVENGFVKGRYGIVGEASVLNNKIYVRPSVRGGLWVKLKSYGVSGHASDPSKGVNAVLNMAKLLIYLKENFKLGKYYTHSILPPPSICVGTMIKGGIKENVIPDYCEAYCDIRIIPGLSRDEAIEYLNNLIEESGKSINNLKVDLEVVNYVEPAEIPLESNIMKVVIESTEYVAGYKPDYLGGTGSNDSTYLINNADVESICGFGPGDGLLGNMHSINERISIDMLIKFTKIYADVIRRIYG